MRYAHLMLLALGGLVPQEPSPRELVAKLGSGRFAERMEAAFTLRRLDQAALPALRAAEDPTVRRRAALVIDAIESQRLIRPTPIRLAFRDRPLDEVVAEVRSQGGLPVVLEPEGDPAWHRRRITLEAPEPVPFWEALDRLGEVGGVRHNPGPLYDPGQHTPRVLLIAGADPPIPTAYSGPFRVNLISLCRHRQVTLALRPAEPEVREEFTALIQLFAEPGRIIDRNGPPRLLEAVDDRGQDLRTDSGWEPASRSSYGRRFDQGQLVILSYPIPLKLPDDPGRKVRRLRGVLPITVRARTDDRLIVPLEDAEGRTFSDRGLGVSLAVAKIGRQEQNTSIQLTLRPEDRPLEDATLLAGLRQDGLGPAPTWFRLEDHLQIRDGRGRVCWWDATSTPTEREGEIEVRLTVYPTGSVGPPAELRYHGVVGAAVAVPFEFTDLPMP
jgi:hypothetical protein